jgi:phosphoglucomutase
LATRLSEQIRIVRDGGDCKRAEEKQARESKRLRRKAAKVVREAARGKRIRRELAWKIIQCLRDDEYADWHPEVAAKAMQGRIEELEESFYRVIPFGTAGQRGPVGPGPNRINDRTLALSVQGVCDYVLRCRDDAGLSKMKQQGPLKAVVAYDTRMDSVCFAQLVTEVLLGNGLEVRLFDGPAATPELSHALLSEKAAIGFMVSASHNPPGDNGIKVYWNYGGQVLPGRANAIQKATGKVRRVRRLGFDEGCRRRLVRSIGPETDEDYVASVFRQGMTTSTGAVPRRQARLVYSPLHGTGGRTVIPVLQRAGWEIGRNLFVVESQRRPDPKFRGVPNGIPNPELPKCLAAGVELAGKVGADLVLATDPDADRLALRLTGPPHATAPAFLLGGQLSAVLGEWVLSQLEAHGRPVAGCTVVKSIVTSDLVDDVIASHCAKQTLVGVGFKYVAEVSRDLQDTPERFLFGCEQSYGFLRGMHCRDKDGAVAALLAAELCDAMKRRGKTIGDYLASLWARHGYYAERATPTRPRGCTGIVALERIQETMRELRAGFPSHLGGLAVRVVEDALHDETFDPATRSKRSAKRWEDKSDPYSVLYGKTGTLGWGWTGENILVARLKLNPESWVIVRPSGTEPSLKIYVNIHAPLRGKPLAEVALTAEKRALAIERDLKRLMDVE